MMTIPAFEELPVAARCAVAESPVWDEAGETLYWVDIIGRKVFRHHLESANTAIWDTDDFPTAIALSETPGSAVLALANGVAGLNLTTGAVEVRCRPDPLSGNRLNEGKCDPQGRFWVGSMQTNLNPDGTGREMDRNSGALFRIDPDFSSTRHTDREFGISNTMAWAPNGRVFYFGDTIRNIIFSYEFDPDAGAVGKRRVLIEGYAMGLPDGSAIDVDGCLWNARFGGGTVIRIAPDGRVDREVPVPMTNPTSCAFAGSSRQRLVVTSATFGLSEEQIASNPHEGKVICIDVGVSGMPDYKFAGAG